MTKFVGLLGKYDVKDGGYIGLVVITLPIEPPKKGYVDWDGARAYLLAHLPLQQTINAHGQDAVYEELESSDLEDAFDDDADLALQPTELVSAKFDDYSQLVLSFLKKMKNKKGKIIRLTPSIELQFDVQPLVSL